MKEISIEEKARRYDEAIYRVKHFLTVIGVSPDDEPVDVAKRMSEYIFPEFAESEDERIRKQIIYAIKELHVCDETKRKCIAWLEKKCEQKPWSEEDKKLIDDTCHLINTLASGYGEKVTEPITFSGTQMIASIKDRLMALVDNRPQSLWKPSREQMEAMQKALVDLCGKDEHNIITGLYYDLKKLKV